ncbi:MAG: hypothetical protein ACPGWS_09490, partial [Solirubrobacterales bacterium]
SDRYRPVDVCIYSSADFSALSAPQPNAQSLFMRLLTSGHDRSIPGLHVIGLGGLADELQWGFEETREKFAEIEGQGMARAEWRSRVVWMRAAISHRPPSNQNVVKGWGRYWREIPECALKLEAWEETCQWFNEHRPEWIETFVASCPRPRDLTDTRPPPTPSSPTDEAATVPAAPAPTEQLGLPTEMGSVEAPTVGKEPFGERLPNQRKRKRKRSQDRYSEQEIATEEQGACPRSPAFYSGKSEPEADFAFVVREWRARDIGDAHYSDATRMIVEATVLLNPERRKRTWIREFLDRLKSTPACAGWSIKRAFSNPVEIDRIWRGEFRSRSRGSAPSSRGSRGRQSVAAQMADEGARLRAQLARSDQQRVPDPTREAPPAETRGERVAEVIDLPQAHWAEATEDKNVG